MAIRLLSSETVDGSGQFAGVLKITETGTAQHILIGNQDSGGANKPGMIRSANASLEFGYGNSWSGEGGTMTTSLTIGSDSNATFAGRVDILDDLRIRGAGGNPSQGIVRFYTDSTNKLTIDTGNTGANLTTIDSSGNAIFSGSVKGTIAMFNTLNNQANSHNIIYRTGTTTVIGGGSSSNKLYVLDNGDVGVNLSSPSEKLDVDGSVKIGNIKLQNASGGRIGFNRNTANGVIYDSNFSAFQINGATSTQDYLSFEAYNSSGTFQSQMVYTNSGNLGIGTTSPSSKLELNETDDTFNDLSVLTLKRVWSTASTNDRSHGIKFNDTNAALAYIYADRTNSAGNYNGDLVFHTNSGSSGTDTSEKMRITSGGNVGIGYNNPTAKLSVNGDGGFVSNSSSRVLYLTQNATNSGNIIQFLDQNGSNIWELVGRNNQFYIYNNALNAFAMYINPTTNNIGIGTNNTGNKLNVPGTINLHSLGFVDVDPLNSGSNSIWSKIGTWATGQGGRNLSLKLAAGQGYNASLSQNGELHLELRTSNGAATAPNISGRWWIEGQGNFVTNVRVKEVSTSEYEVYIQHNNFIGAGNIQVDVGDIDNWDSDISYNTGVPTGTLLNPSQINYFRGDQYAISSNFITTGNFCVDTTSPTHALTIDRASGGIDLRGGNNRIYFTANRAMEGASDGSLLQIGESYSNTALYGNVGIGTTSPPEKLEVAGNVAIRDTYKIYFNHNTNTNRYIGASSTNDLDIAADDDINYRSNYHRFFNGSTEFARLSSSTNSWIANGSNGKLGIGKTNPAYNLDVTGSIYCTAAYVRASTAPDIWYSNNNTGTYNQTVLYMNQSNSSNTDSNGYFLERGRISNSSSAEIRRWVIGARGGQKQMMLDGPGTLTVAGDMVAYGSPSDKRYKENIKPVTNALYKVSKLQGVTFDWKESESILDIKEDIGFIAQDVQEVLPELVRENEDGKLSLRDKGIVPILVEAIKELKAEIEELKNNK